MAELIKTRKKEIYDRRTIHTVLQSTDFTLLSIDVPPNWNRRKNTQQK